ncbi:MAG: HDIG domain-containing protein [Planctomycetia bacterium]|nr:HDIG domain-containing protein [Planctomycetia bacterium]
MSTPNRPKTRAERVAQHVVQVGLFEKIKAFLFADHGLLKFGLVSAVALILSTIIQGWNPPFMFHLLKRVERDVASRVAFSVKSPDKTQEARLNAKLDTPHVYSHEKTKLTQFKARLTNTIQSLLSIENYEAMKPEDIEKWKLFLPANSTPEEAALAFTRLQKALEKDIEAKRFELAIDRVFQPYETNGILIRLHGSRDGNQERIAVYNQDDPNEEKRFVSVRDVLIGNAYLIKDRLNQEFERSIADILFHWIRPAIPETLTENREQTVKAQNIAIDSVGDVFTKYEPRQVIVKGGNTIEPQDFLLLKEEQKNILKERLPSQRIMRYCGVFVLILIMLLASYFLIIGRFVNCQKSQSVANFSLLYGLLILTVVFGRFFQIFFNNQGANPELVPLLVYAQIITFAFSWEIASIVSMIATLVLMLSGFFDLGVFLTIVGAISVVIFFTRTIQRRSNLLFAAAYGGLAAFLLSFCVGLLKDLNHDTIIVESVLRLTWTIFAGFIITGILPLAEKMFGILTPMRLLEIGSPSNPLLQELARRAPASYNHSMQTAAIAEAAAEAIGAQCALVRVGAYFHDIGKILKPEYFTENQGPGTVNIHDSLEPRISTLVIVAHVKDGVDLARQHHLPKAIVDLIEQHHGTMLVSFFYNVANKKSMEEYEQPLEEREFRYPGPVPQSKEAGILMLADAAESASRSLADPTPTRIESLVKKLLESRVEDGQFDDSGLTLGELRTIEKSIINSILASRHSRIKYPEKPAKNDTSDNGNAPSVSNININGNSVNGNTTNGNPANGN